MILSAIIPSPHPEPSATALASVMPSAPWDAAAITTPTAMPSGRLWMVTAKTGIAN